MIRSEWKKLKSPMMLIVILALVLVPFLYNFIFLSAFWDPYGQTDNVKIAVVNEDRVVEYEGENIDIGDQFIDKLKDNDDFDWQFLNRKQAEKKLRNGDLYMMVVIPKDFSHNATTLLDEDPKKIELDYYLNPAKNFSGTQISSTAANRLNEQIRKSVTKQYSSAIFDGLKTLADGLSDAAEGSSKLESGAIQTTEGAQTLSTNLSKLTEGTNDLSTNLTKAASGMTELSAGIHKINDGNQTIASKSSELSSGLGTLASNNAKINNGAKDLLNATTAIRQGVEPLAAGTAELNNSLPPFIDGLNQLDATAQEVDSKINSIHDEAATLKQNLTARQETLQTNVDQVKQVINASETLTQEEKDTLLQSISTMTQSISQLSDQSNAIDASVAVADEAAQKINQLADGGRQIASAVSEINSGQNQVLGAMRELESGQAAFNKGLLPYTAGVEQAANGSAQLASGANELATGANDAAVASDTLVSGLNQLSDGAASITNGANQLTDGATRLTDGNAQLADGAKTLTSELKKGADDAVIAPSSNRDDMLAEPVVLKEHDYSTVNNYGSGLSAYILSIALFAGSLMFSSVYQIRPEHGERLTWRFLLGKLSVILPIGMLQGVAAATAIVYALDSEVASVPALYAFAALTGMTFITLLFTLTMLLGRVGQFSAFLLLLLQIGGSGGTFPVEMTPQFFQKIHPYLPMTYTVGGFREALGLGVTNAFYHNMFIVSLLFVVVLSIGFGGSLLGKRLLLSTKEGKKHDPVG